MEILTPGRSAVRLAGLALLGVPLVYAATRFPMLFGYVAAAAALVLLTYMVARKWGAVSLLVLTAPINRLFIEIGFALKPFYIAVAILGILALMRRRSSIRVVTNRDFILCALFLLSVLLSAFANGAPEISFRHLLVMVLVFAGCYQLYQAVNTVDDVRRLQQVYLFTGLFVGVAGLFFYAIFLLRPEMVVEGSFFEGVTIELEREGMAPMLQSFDKGSNGYGMDLLPFIFAALASMLDHTSTTRLRAFAASVFTLLIANLLLTFSRGGVLAFLLAAIPLVLMVRGHRRLKWVVAALVVCLPIFMLSQLVDLYVEYSNLKGSAVLSDREELARESLKVIGEHPIFGVGQGRIVDERYVGKQSHNTYLELLGENGIATFAIFMMLLWSLAVHVRYMYRTVRSPELYYPLLGFSFGAFALLLAAIPTSGITLTVLWMQFTIIVAMARVVRQSVHT